LDLDDKILVAIPAYNCEKQISRVLKQFDDEMQNLFTEILVIDNCSSDQSLANAEQIMAELQSIKCTIKKNTDNYGLGGSHKVGFEHAVKGNFDYIVILHGDDQGSIKDLVPHLKSGRHRQFDFFLGARFLPGSKLENYSMIRTYGNLFFNTLYSIVVGRRLYDLGSGLNVFSVNALKKIKYKKLANDMTFNYYLTLGLRPQNISFEYFPLTWREEDQNSNIRLFRQAIQTLIILGKYIYNPNKFIVTDHSNKPDKNYPSKIIFQNNPTK
jgi:dolichol-phosphate mannosyltransferase